MFVVLSLILLFNQFSHKEHLLTKAEFILDLDKDGINDFVSFSSGRIALSSNSFKIERIPKLSPKLVFQNNSELWIEKRRKALGFRNGKIVLRPLNIKEQILARIVRMDNLRASLLTFDLVLTLLFNLLALESIFNFTKRIFSKKDRFRVKDKHFFQTVIQKKFDLVSIFLLIAIGFFMGKIAYAVWIWILFPFSYLALPLLFKSRVLEILKGIAIILSLFIFQYLCYFGFWLPEIKF